VISSLPIPLHITLAHELLHAIHFHCSAEDFRSKSNNNIPLFDNEEEKLTICGEGSDINVLELCENRFLEVAGLPCRINHCGVTKKTSIPIEQLGILDFLTAEAWGSFKNLIEKDSTKVNELAVNPENEKQSCLPLSLVRSLNGMELLLKEGARIDLLDDLGGPIVAAFEDSYGLAAYLINQAIQRGHRIDLESLLETLIKGYNSDQYKIKTNDGEGNWVFVIANFIERIQSQLGKKSDLPIMHRMLKELEKDNLLKLKYKEKIDGNRNFYADLLKWTLEENEYKFLSSYDDQGNSFLMSLSLYLKQIKNTFTEKSKWRSGLALSVLFFRSMHENLNFEHINNKGETLLSLIREVEEPDLTKAVEKALAALKPVREMRAIEARVETIPDN